MIMFNLNGPKESRRRVLVSMEREESREDIEESGDSVWIWKN